MKRIIIIAVLCLMVCLGYAVLIPQGEAQTIGISVFTHLSGSQPAFRNSEPYFGSYAAEEADFYILRFRPAGFILVAAEDRSSPILGYSLTNEFPEGDLPAHVAWYLDQYSRSITEIRQNPDWQMDAAWSALRQGDCAAYSYNRNVAPLLGTTWDQDDPYNYYCPADASGPGGRVYAGCVATAMAQVMKKWNHPVTGAGSNSYYASGYGTQSANFGATTYNWAAMPNSISSVNTSIATLIYHCGVAVNMSYSPNGSGAYAEDARTALVNKFRYNSAAQFRDASSYSSTVWAAMLRGDLDLGRPIFYRGQGDVGHAFVLDGYQGTNSFHFNWGWSGYYDGYFYLNNLNPGSHSFNQYQGAILNVFPLSQANLNGMVSSGGTSLVGATVSVAGTSYSATTAAYGGYTISAIPAGTYQVTASMVGYNPSTQSVTLLPGQTTTVNFNLTETGQPTDLYPPSNFHASVVGNSVHLGWNAPEPPASGEWITWCNPEISGNAIGTGAAVIFDVAHRFDSADLAPYQGSTLTHVSFVPAQANCVYTLKVWTGGTTTIPGNMVHSQIVSAPIIDVWNDVLLTIPIPIPATGNLWFGYEVNTQNGHPASCDDGPMVPGKGNIMRYNDSWTTLAQLTDPPYQYNWSIQGYVNHNRAMVQMPEPVYEAPQAFQDGQLALQVNSNASVGSVMNRTRQQIGYKLYRGGNLIATLNNPATLSYIDAGLTLGSYSYTLTAYYDTGESLPAGPLGVVLEGLPAPTDLAATVEGNDVSLSWTNPVPPQTGEWISWSDNTTIGNGVGTGSVANFDVAHRYAASDLSQYVGGVLTQVKFVPNYVDCIYTIKIWTGGSTTAPGSLVHSQIVNSPTVEAWTTATLTTPVPIAAGTQYWIGYNANTQGGYPAGCDNGPMEAGKGNIMQFNNNWTTLDQLTDPPLYYNWMIQGFVAQGRSLKAIQLPDLVEAPQPLTNGQLSSNSVTISRDLTRAVLLGYKVYRNGVALAQINDPAVISYTDHNLPNGNYVYGVSALYNTGESAMVTINVNVDLELAPAILEDGFEYYSDFATAFGNWNLIDQDNSSTCGFVDHLFPGSGAPMSYIIFNPSQAAPPITDVAPYEGNKMAACFTSLPPPNKDWLITERLTLGTNSSLRFQARSHSAQYGLERFKVGVSTLPVSIIQGFHFISGTSYIEAPASWTEYIYDLSAYDGQEVYIAILCTSYDAFVFYVDEFSVHSQGGGPQQDPFGAPMVLPTSMSIVANVTINGQQASGGDVVAAFVSVNGMPELRGKQTVQIESGIAGCILQVYTETADETVSFRVWERSGNQLLFSPTTLNTIVNGTVGDWPNNLFVIDAGQGDSQTIPLASGWNLVSLNVSPADHDLGTVLAPISASVMQVKGLEGIYFPGNPYSTLSAVTDGKAYNIQLSADAAWTVAGTQIPAATPLALEDGWNMAAYLPQSPMPVATALQSVSTWLQQVKGSDGVYDPGSPYSTLTTMSAGKGYWIKLAGAHELIYPVGRELAFAPKAAKPRLEVKPLSSSMVLLARCDWAAPGDILLARVNTELRGAEEFIIPESFPAALLQIYTEEADEKISLWLQRADGSEVELANSFTSQPHANLGSYPEFIVLETKTGNDDDIALPTHFYGCYPNPFNPSTTISFSLAHDNTQVGVNIYNLKGQRVRQLAHASYAPGQHYLIWDGADDGGRTLSSGIYLIELKAGAYRRAAKVMLAK